MVVRKTGRARRFAYDYFRLLAPGDDLEAWSLCRELETGKAPIMFFSFPTEEAMRGAWEELREELLERAAPGTRPFAWWLFEGIPTHGPRRTTASYRDEHGAAFTRHGILWGNGILEPQADYLDRHDLLTPSERDELHLWSSLNRSTAR